MWARDATGRLLPRRALTGVVSGHDFPVVWICREQDYEKAISHSQPPERGDLDAPGIPWPEEDVTPRLVVPAPSEVGGRE